MLTEDVRKSIEPWMAGLEVWQRRELPDESVPFIVGGIGTASEQLLYRLQKVYFGTHQRVAIVALLSHVRREGDVWGHG